jgi:hypothetical protein
MKHIACLAGLLVVAACGGGGDLAGPKLPSAEAAASAPVQQMPAMNAGVTVDSVELLTVAPTAAMPLSFRVRATVVGSVPANTIGFDLRVVVNRTDATSASTAWFAEGVMPFALISGTPSSGSWRGTAIVTLPPQPAGPHSFAGIVDPNATFDFTGSWSSGVTGTLDIAP